MKPYLLPLALLLAGCANHGDLAPAIRPVDGAGLATAQTLSGPAAQGAPAAAWWREFGDPQLDALIDEALQSAPSLQLAAARLRQALAQAGVADSATRPRVMGNYQGDRERMSEHFLYPPPFGGSTVTMSRLALDFSYELDFWGRHRETMKGAQSEARAAELERETARLVLATGIARSYVELDRLLSLQALSDRQLQAAREAAHLVDQRFAAGIDNEPARNRARVQAAALENEQAAIAEQVLRVRHQLAALLGAGPDRGLAIGRPDLKNAGALALPSVLPAELMGRRPDVVAQRLRVEAAEHYAEATKADFYPNVNLSAFLGFQSIGTDTLLKSGSRIAGLGPAVSLPIYAGGNTRARVAGRYAEYDAAAAQYNATLTTALREIADAVGAWRAVEEREAAQRVATNESGRAFDAARRRHEAGVDNRLAVIGAETEAIAEQRRSADLRAQRFAAAIELARALGGGYAESTVLARR
ncbi:efflux transporter outer membrane subunit [Denitratisoma sp. DHT3]|uniref:efflux transporter outer membrane subunit n=1 Tax=Denitratisoma sp. DHT3 TaxID=1981880 RepID=UPI001645F4CF|nr:efflux transporter outer membrane subunit [Denitratisoma sp. DHT3]